MPVANLYNLSTNVTDIFGWINNTVSNVCVDPSNSASCGSFIFGNAFLFFFALFLFAGFRQKTDIRGAFAGSVTITAIISILFAVLTWIDPITVIFLMVMVFFGLIGIWTRKVEYIR